MKGGPLVSILIPTHNRVFSLQRAIESCLKQTYEPLEILVVDDASNPPARESVSETIRFLFARTEQCEKGRCAVALPVISEIGSSWLTPSKK